MTTAITVEAHCATTKEVHFTVTDPSIGVVEKVVMEDGKKVTMYVYDGRVATVTEVLKAP